MTGGTATAGNNDSKPPSMLDVMILLIGSRQAAAIALGFLGLFKNGCRLEFSMGFWFVILFTAFRDFISALLYEQEDKQKYGYAVGDFLVVVCASMCLMMIKKLVDGKGKNGQGANTGVSGGMTVMNTAPNDANTTNRLNMAQPGDSQLGLVQNMQIK